jgi:fatty acid desaturase
VIWTPAPRDMPVPRRLNIALLCLVGAAAVGLLVAASRLHAPLALLTVAVAFSYVMLTAYALMHEAAHGNLHPAPPLNHALGVLIAALFPAPFSAIRTTHQGHHLRNRTDYEMFDLYYPHESAWLRRIQWYGTLCGLFWPLVPLGALAFCVAPPVLRTPLFERARSSAYLLGDIRAEEVRAIRWETAFVVVAQAGILWLCGGRFSTLLLCYGCFAFNWSTRQYVGHAFTRRHVVEGAFNLRHNRLMSLLLLHGEWDLNHHRRPDVPWYYLPRLPIADEERPAYGGQYRRMWRGPRENTEPAPESLEHLPLSVHG